MENKAVVITCFEPFGGESVNASEELVKMLPDEIGGCRIVKLRLPTSFMKCRDALMRAMDEHNPCAVISFGEAGGRSDITPEFVAINWRDARICDNSGYKPEGEPIIDGADRAYFTTLPVKVIVNALRDKGAPAKISYSCGTYVCNEAMYSALYTADVRKKSIACGFIHVPTLKGMSESALGLKHVCDAMIYALGEAMREIAK